MSLHYRKRGDIWHLRGTVRVGSERIKINEQSTGCRTRADAEAAGAAEEAKIRRQVLDGAAGSVLAAHTIAEAITAYTSRPKGVASYDIDRLLDFNDRVGAYPVADARAAWAEWMRTRGKNMAAATAARHRAILQAALAHGADDLGYVSPKLPTVAQNTQEGVIYLTHEEQELLLASYNAHAGPVALMLCYQGLRTQEALRMDWREINLERGIIHIPAERVKTRKGRAVPMHPKVKAMLTTICADRRNPTTGPVFMSSRNAAYADTRGKGGNPLTQAHRTACKAAGLQKFRVHDWRHHWASHMVMTGCDLLTLMRLGGWTSPRMVQRYAAVSGEHMAEAISRLK